VITLFLLLIVGLLTILCVGLWRLVEQVEDLSNNVNKLRLSGRSVQKKAVLRDGVLTNEREMTRLGRATRSKRIVVGGDPDSGLNEALSRGMSDDTDND
jgi:hypothetical protein